MNPSIVLHVLTECNLDPQDLARLEASFCVYGFRIAEWIANCQACLASFLQYILMIVMLTWLNCFVILQASSRFFRQSANFSPDFNLSISELAALDMCQSRAVFKPMTQSERETLKERCGGSWKLVLRFLVAGETCYRREKSQAIAGPGHSVVVTKSSVVYTFGSNSSEQLGHGTTDEEWRPRLIRCAINACVFFCLVFFPRCTVLLQC